jgi:hypothetical protein
MKTTKRQLYVLCDLEGASGISPENRQAMHHGSDPWPAEGWRFNPGKRFFLRRLARLIFFRLSKGRMSENEASWETKTVVRGLYALHCTRGFMTRRAG